MSKHQEILDYLLKLEIGKRVSVRSISNYLSVSEGTAYRAIKEAETRGIVETRPRSGTVRVKQKSSLRIAKISYAEIARISDSEVVAGSKGLNHAFSKFSIGAMTLNNIKSYLVKGGLLIVGDRENIQLLALENANAVLVTGGFSVSKKVREAANRLQIPVMVTTYDTFTVATMINQALATIEDIEGIKEVNQFYEKKDDFGFLKEKDIIDDFYKLFHETGHVRFPVTDNDNNLVGIVTMRDVIAHDSQTSIKRVMTTDVIVTTLHEPIVRIGQKMTYQDLNIIPVVTSKRKLIGVIQRRRVFENLPLYNDQQARLNSKSLFEIHSDGENDFFVVEPAMLDKNGYLCPEIIQESLTQYFRKLFSISVYSLRLQQMMIYNLNPIVAESCLIIKKVILEETDEDTIFELQYLSENLQIVKIIVNVVLKEKK